MEKDFIESNGEKIYFYVQRKNVKNINLKVNIDKKVTLSIPMKKRLTFPFFFPSQQTRHANT